MKSAAELPLLQTLFVCEGYSDDPVHGTGEEDGVCGGGDMIIDKKILDSLTAAAKASPRQRMNTTCGTRRKTALSGC